nr:putative reverse transcriptase domain-containing protein [Tanacetum cinerariifolium]
AYRLRLPNELSEVHDTFHVSNLKKCLADANLHVPLDEIKVDKTFHFVEKPVKIMDREVKNLKHSKIHIVKVRWSSKRGPEFTWEREDHMKARGYCDNCVLSRLVNRIEVSQGKDCVEIKQERYARKILKEADMKDCNAISYPMKKDLKLSKAEDQPEVEATQYQKVQTTMALSLYKAEFIAATAAVCQAIWLRELLAEVTGLERQKVIIRVDNKSAIALSKNPVFHGRSKHIYTQYHFIRECVKNGQSLQENTGFWQAPNPYEVSVEQVATSPTKKKHATRNRQKKTIQSDDAPRQTPWTTEEEIALCKGWLAISENSEHVRSSNVRYGVRKQYGRRTYDMVLGKWKTVRPSVVRFCWIYNNIMRMGPESGAEDTDYVQRAMIHYEINTELPFKLRHCWEILKDHPKWQEIAIPNFNTGSEGGSKRHKSTGSSSFNTESGEASINLNTNVDDNDEDKVQEIQRPEGKDKALEKEERLAFLEIKRRKVECHERELEQQDMRFYVQPPITWSGTIERQWMK